MTALTLDALKAKFAKKFLSDKGENPTEEQIQGLLSELDSEDDSLPGEQPLDPVETEVVAKPHVSTRDIERVQNSLNTMYLLKARRIAHSLDRKGISADHSLRTFAIAPKWLAEAHRVGITRLAGLRLVK
jgi:hypothetical protein